MALDNVWSFLTAVTGVVGTIASAIIAAYLALHQKQTNRIETLVNGNLHREQEDNKHLRRDNERLRSVLEKHGIDDVTDG